MNAPIIRGCPVADNLPACPRCGGAWPGTRITTAGMTKAVAQRTIIPARLGCGVLQERAEQGLERVRKV